MKKNKQIKTGTYSATFSVPELIKWVTCPKCKHVLYGMKVEMINPTHRIVSKWTWDKKFKKGKREKE